MSVSAFKFSEKCRLIAVHLSPSEFGGFHVHAAIDEGGTWGIAPRTTKQICPSLMLRTIDVAIREHISIFSFCFRGRCTNDVAIPCRSARYEPNIAVIEKHRSSTTDEIHRSCYLAVFQIGRSAIVGVVRVLRTHQAHILQHVSLAILFIERYGTVGKEGGVILEV